MEKQRSGTEDKNISDKASKATNQPDHPSRSAEERSNTAPEFELKQDSINLPQNKKPKKH